MSLDRFPSDAAAFEVEKTDARDLAARMSEQAPVVAGFLKALSHEGRLMILCHLAAGERSVTELEELLGQRQAAVSQQLARLRLEGLVSTRREGKAIYYAVRDARVLTFLKLLPEMLGRAA
jgi:DNA-binding transcriptional ArsR family regulator